MNFYFGGLLLLSRKIKTKYNVTWWRATYLAGSFLYHSCYLQVSPRCFFRTILPQEMRWYIALDADGYPLEDQRDFDLVNLQGSRWTYQNWFGSLNQ